MGVRGMYGFDNSLNIPSFNEVIPTDTNKGQNVDTADTSGEIVVSFGKGKTPPRFSTSEQVSVDFINEDVKSVLRYIAELYDLNIIIPTALTGSVTLRLKNVDWKALLTAVLTPLGCAYAETDGIIQIVSESMARQEPLLTKTFLLKFADAKTIADELKDFVDKEAKEKLSFNERTNILIWTGRAKNLANIEDIIAKLDKPETQVMIEAKFVETSNTVKPPTGFTWPTGLDVSLDAETKTPGVKGGREIGLNKSKVFRNSSIFIQTLTGSFNFSQTDNIGKTLSNPTIITMNNVPATIGVTTQYPLPKYSYNTEKNICEITGIDEKSAGITLKVTPKVQSKYITLQIEPNLSNNDENTSLTVGGSTINYPKIKEKKASSTVTIESGRAIAIGGLMEETNSDDRTKVSFLGDIPLIGNMFVKKEKKKTITNLIIFLSATQIAYDGTIIYPTQVGAKNISDRKLFQMGFSDKDMPGEAEMSDKEKELYARLKTLQSKLDNIELEKKAGAEDEKLTKSINKATKPKKERSVGKGRSAKLHKSQQAPKTVHVRKRGIKKNS